MTFLVLFGYFEQSICSESLKIILKFDDLYAFNGICPSKPTMNYLIKKQIKFSYGVIAQNLDETSLGILSPYLNATGPYGNKLFEIWNHGLDHIGFEFFGTPYKYQKDHFDQATKLVKKYLGIQMHSFSAPFNANDTTTIRVISEDTNYKVFLLCNVVYPKPGGVLFLNWPRVEMERGIGFTDFDYFVKNYNINLKYSPKYMILQGHPNNWANPQLENFYKIIDFLIDQGCEFVLPYEYYLSLNLFPPTDLRAEQVSLKKIELSWLDNAFTEYNYIIERSIDSVNWIFIGTAPENSTTFTDNNIHSSTGIYFYRVYANCGVKSSFSNLIRVKVPFSEENEIPLIFNVFPTPCRDKITIIWSTFKSQVITCEIYDLNGIMKYALFSGPFHLGDYRFSFDVSNLKPGMYLCRIYSPLGFSTTKILVKNV